MLVALAAVVVGVYFNFYVCSVGEKALISVDLSKHMITHMNCELTSDIEEVEKLNLDQNSISKLENLAHLKHLQQVI